MFPEDCKYTKEHEWIREEDGTYIIGITDHASEQMGDITYVELPEVGAEFHQGDAIGCVESVKAASDVYAPAGGTVAAVNDELEGSPELVNQSPYETGWLVKMEDVDASGLASLMDAKAYETYVAEHAE